MAQYDDETLYLHALYMQALLTQVACDAVAQIAYSTGDEAIVEQFCDQVASTTIEGLVVSKRKGSTPVRDGLARAITKTRLRAELVPALRTTGARALAYRAAKDRTLNG